MRFAEKAESFPKNEVCLLIMRAMSFIAVKRAECNRFFAFGGRLFLRRPRCVTGAGGFGSLDAASGVRRAATALGEGSNEPRQA